MKELEYPFNSSFIIENARRLKKNLLASRSEFLEKKIAVLGGSTTAHIVRMLDLFLLNHGIKASFYESEYNKFYEDSIFPNERLESFAPDIIYIHTTNRNIDSFPVMTDDNKIISQKLENVSEKFLSVWENLSRKYNCPIIQNNFELPFYRLMGNKDSSDIHGKINFITRLNEKFYEYAQSHENFFICDINYISADYGLKSWSDPHYWYMYKYALNLDAVPYLAFNVANIIKSIFGRNKKGLVLDLDNTLWGGVISEENIKLGSEDASGLVYTEFQKYIKSLKQIGIILAIDSKNDENIALSGLNHPDSELRPEDFASIKANWHSKDSNLIEIAGEINLLPESLVFIDDNPAERHIVSEQLPGVSVPEIGESSQYIYNIDRNGYFEVTALSQDDLNRNSMYQANQERIKSQAAFKNYDEYLESLEMKAVIKPFEKIFIPRITQLTNKTNQFNLTTRRYTQSEIEEIYNDSGYITLYGRLIDKFGDNGVVSIVIGRKENFACHIDLWLMSCRVLKRNFEQAMMDEFISRCKDSGIHEVIGCYLPTAKNSMVKDFYSSMGFTQISCDENKTVYNIRVDSYVKQNKFIEIER